MKCAAHFGRFAVRYNGRDLLEIVDQRLHPALRLEAGAPQITHGIAYDEWEAAERYGYSDYWNAPREARAMMCASIKARVLVEVMTRHDYTELARKKADQERRRKGGRNG